jgi:hypothetical protein
VTVQNIVLPGTYEILISKYSTKFDAKTYKLQIIIECHIKTMQRFSLLMIRGTSGTLGIAKSIGKKTVFVIVTRTENNTTSALDNKQHTLM